MPQDERPMEIAQLAKLVAWIDEQRTLDKDATAKLSQQVERLTQSSREQTAQIVDFQDRLRQVQGGLSHLPLVDSALRQLREQASEMQRALQDADQRAARSAGLGQAESSRLAKELTGLVQRLDELHRRNEALQSRLNLIGEEVKHDRATAALVPQLVENSEKQVAAFNSRLQLLAEHVKRAEGQIGSLEQTRDGLRVEHRRLWQWQQAAELRWARQLAEWEQYIGQWQMLLQEQSKVVQELTKDTTHLKQELERVAREVDRQRDRLDEFQDAVQRLENGQQVTTEEINLLMQGTEAQRRRNEELGFNVQQVDEMLRREAANITAVGRRLDGERSRLDEITKALQQDEMDQRGDRDELVRLQRELQSQRFCLDEALARLLQEVGELRKAHRDRLAETIGVQERQLLRQIDELEQQVRELREQREGIVGSLREPSENVTRN